MSLFFLLMILEEPLPSVSGTQQLRGLQGRKQSMGQRDCTQRAQHTS